MAGVGRFGTRAWADLGEDPALLDRIEAPTRPVPLPSTLAVGELAADSVALASLAVNLARATRTAGARPAPGAVPTVRIVPERVAASYRSERLFRHDGEPMRAWAPLSGFWEAADGWVRTHGNYPHHAQRLRALLGLPDKAGPEQLRTAVATREAAALEDGAAEVGAILARVRDAETWRAHPQSLAVAGRPLVEQVRRGEAAPRRWPDAGPLPLSGVRVLDLTRVIAGPVGTRDLALAGADVLRVDTPHTPEIEVQHLDTGQGKRSTLLDLTSRTGLAALTGLLAAADVVVTGYRPGSLDRFGLDPDTLAARFPGLVTAAISAWDTVGPWSGRRGFDSIVQAATGIAMAESGTGAAPGALPAQALDHSAGHLLAAGVLSALTRQRTEGGSHHVAVALARVGQELLARAGVTPGTVEDAELPVVTGQGAAGRITCAPPVLAFVGAPAAYAWMSRPWGTDEPRWA